METMKNKAGDFYVEKVIKKKEENGVIFYYVKWVGYPDYDNTWEPVQHLQNCKGLIAEFLKTKQRNEKKANQSAKLVKNLPDSICNGLYKDYPTKLEGVENLDTKLSGHYYPMRLIHVTNFNGEIYYVVQWNNLLNPISKDDDGKFNASNTSIVSGKQFREKFPKMVIQFYESLPRMCRQELYSDGD